MFYILYKIAVKFLKINFCRVYNMIEITYERENVIVPLPDISTNVTV